MTVYKDPEVNMFVKVKKKTTTQYHEAVLFSVCYVFKSHWWFPCQKT